MPRALRAAAAILAGAVCLAACAAVADVALTGQAIWRIGDVRILRADYAGGPLVLALVSAAILLRLLRRSWYERLATVQTGRGWAVTAVAVVAAYYGVSGPWVLHGDGIEYVLQTQSIVFDRSLAVDTEARREYWNRTNPFGMRLTEAQPAQPAAVVRKDTYAAGGYGGLYPDRNGDYRFYHFWAYPLVVAPVYLLCHLLDPSGTLEYLSFRWVNVGLLLLVLLLAWRLARSWPAVAMLVTMVFSPLVAYCDWQHPEIFCLSLTFAAFVLAASPRGAAAAPIPLGVAASMNPPILLFLPVLLVVTLTGGTIVRRGPLAAGYLAGAAAGLSAPAYFVAHFGTPSVIAAVGLASLDYASLPRALDILVNPFVGAAFFFPAAFLALPACVTRRNAATLGAILAGVLAAAWLASSTANLNAGQFGTIRYAVWLLAPVWFYVFRFAPVRFGDVPRGWLLAAGLAAGAALLIHLGAPGMPEKRLERFEGTMRARPEVAAIVRHDPFVGDIEIVTEQILGDNILNPVDFHMVYVWDLGEDQCLWVVSGRSLAAGAPLLVRRGPGPLAVTADPPQPVGLAAEGSLARIDLPEAGRRLRRHPVLGAYLTLRSRGRIDAIVQNQPMVLRSDRIVMDAGAGGTATPGAR